MRFDELDPANGHRSRWEVAEACRPPGSAKRIVAAGGGTGVPTVLAGLTGGRTRNGARVDVAAIVTTADDGGSSGELRRAFGIAAPGDVRNCLVALAPDASPLAELFQHRFSGEGGLAGHTVGNLVLTALAQRCGDFDAAVHCAAHLLQARGRVFPSTATAVQLVARLTDGRLVRGETGLAVAGGRIDRVDLDPKPAASTAAVDALKGADLVVLGPGSLYSSVIASLLVDGLADALRACQGFRVLVVNLFTEAGETDGYDATDHVRAIQQHLGPVVDMALVHERSFPPNTIERYAAEGAVPVTYDRDSLARLGVATLAADLVAPGAKARHDPARLGPLLLQLVGGA